MTEEQAQLLLAIVSRLDENAVTGEWPDEECQWCPGRSDGYPYDQSFSHTNNCLTLLIEKLREITPRTYEVWE